MRSQDQSAEAAVRLRDGRDLVDDHWATMARTADLVRKLTALADRYDARHDGDELRNERRRALTARMRGAAEAGRLLLVVALPPEPAAAGPHAVTDQERADRARSRDVQAARRDAAAQVRDERARDRDERLRGVADDGDADFPTRFLAACERDDAAGDRAAARSDRRSAAEDRAASVAPYGQDLEAQAQSYQLITRLEETAIVRQAQGILMAREGMTAGEAFQALLLASTGALSLEGVARGVVREAGVSPAREVT